MNNEKILSKVKRISKKYNIKRKIILKMFEIGIENGYSIDEVEILIEEFKNSNNCY